MTDKKQLKARIRARMAKTGERYTTARRHLVGASDSHVTDHGYALRGGIHPDSALIVNAFNHLGYTGLSEAMVLGIGGGLGAGYILWEFAAHNSKHLTLGYRQRWQYIDWIPNTLDRLGVRYEQHATGGAKAAAAKLDESIAAGRTAIVWPDRMHIGYWHLPAHHDGYGGHPVLAYALTGDRVRVDDRNHAPLTVPREAFDRARGRVGSYKNKLISIAEAPGRLDLPVLVRAGIDDCVDFLGGSSDSFSVPAWRKWSRLTTDRRHAKGWPRVFGDGTALVGALCSIWEGAEPAGMNGGHLRELYADFLDEAAAVLDTPDLTGCAEDFRAAGAAWHQVTEAALPADVPEFVRLRELMATLASAIADGDEGDEAREDAATQLWAMRTDLDRKPPIGDLDALFAAIGERVAAAYEIEKAAVERLAAAA
jgi:hypothetical protein